MDPANDVAEFLTSRRAKVTPEQVASLAGVSVEYYKRLERGQASGVSDGVLEALANALQLDDAERAHLHDLARAVNPVAPKRRRAAQRVRPVVQRIVDAMTTPAIVRNSRVDDLSANPFGLRGTQPGSLGGETAGDRVEADQGGGPCGLSARIRGSEVATPLG